MGAAPIMRAGTVMHECVLPFHRSELRKLKEKYDECASEREVLALEKVFDPPGVPRAER
jgi:hypothetical protein